METTVQKVDALVAGLRKDLHAAKRSRLYSIILGAVLVTILFFVFMNVTFQVKDNVKPDTLATAALYATRTAVKEGRPGLEKAVKDQIPVFLSAMRHSLLNDLIPTLRKEIEVRLTDAVEKTFASSSQSFPNAVKAAVERIKASGGKAPPSTEFLAALVTKEFQVEADRRFSENPQETLGSQYAESKRMLENLNQRLNVLASGKPKNREEAMELRFLRAWVSLVNKGDPNDRLIPGPPVDGTAGAR